MARRAKRSETSDAAPRSGMSGSANRPLPVSEVEGPALSEVEGPRGVLIGIALAEIAEIPAAWDGSASLLGARHFSAEITPHAVARSQQRRAAIPGGGSFRSFRKRYANQHGLALECIPIRRTRLFPSSRPLSSARDGGFRSFRSFRKRYANQHPFDFVQGRPFDFAHGQRTVCAAGHAGAGRRVAGL